MSKKIKKDKLYESAYFNFLKTSNLIEEQVKQALKEHDLTHSQLNVLYILKENDPNPVSNSDINQRILVKSPDLTRLLDRLVKKNLVDRQICPENRRKMNIKLTEHGKQVFKKAGNDAKRSVNNFFENLTEKEAGQLREIMRKVRGD